MASSPCSMIDMLDALERGDARESPTRDTVPVSIEWQHQTIVADGKGLYLRDDDTNEIILSAKLIDGVFYFSKYVDFPAQCQTGVPPTGFVAMLKPDPKSRKYHLYSTACEHCDTLLQKFRCDATACTSERQKLGSISHAKHVSATQHKTRAIGLDIPTVFDQDTRAVVCPRTCEQGGVHIMRLPSFTADPCKSAPALAISEDEAITATTALVPVLPKWNDNTKSLALAFHKRRVTKSSTKNFIVCDPEANRRVLQFGKCGTGLYAIDYRYPLSPLQAFAAAASLWAFLD